MKKAIVLTAGLVLVAGVALASNTGFKLNYPLVTAAGTSSSNWVSFPYFYFPNGNVGASQTAKDMCIDFNGGAGDGTVKSVSKWITGNDQPQTKNCINPLVGFTVAPGEAYNVQPNPAAGAVVLAIVGSHDDTFSANKLGGNDVTVEYAPGTSSSNWISVPYHTIADNAIDLCVAVNGAPKDEHILAAVSRWVSTNDQPQTKNCISPLLGFTLTPGEGVNFQPKDTNGTFQMQFDVY
jgi:hypothetical protein